MSLNYVCHCAPDEAFWADTPSASLSYCIVARQPEIGVS